MTTRGQKRKHESLHSLSPHTSPTTKDCLTRDNKHRVSTRRSNTEGQRNALHGSRRGDVKNMEMPKRELQSLSKRKLQTRESSQRESRNRLVSETRTKGQTPSSSDTKKRSSKRLSKKKESESEKENESESESGSENKSESENEPESESESESEMDEDDKETDEDDKETDNDDSEEIVKRRKKRRLASAAKETPQSLKYHDTVQFSSLKASPMASRLEYAKEQLHPTARAKFLPCREQEFYLIASQLEEAIESGQGSCLYISGVPGTGKTATVQSVMTMLIEKRNKKEIKNFDYFEVNGMALSDPSYVYSLLWKQLQGEKTGASHAAQLLDKYFGQGRLHCRACPLVVLVDELDMFVTRKQKVIYNLFEWPNRPRSQLIVVAIANTMDLPERVMLNRVASRIGLSRHNFEPYTHPQLMQIVESRLAGLDILTTDAIEMCARKVSAVSGDARRALDICRHAVKLLENTGKAKEGITPQGPQVTLDIIRRAIHEIFAAPAVIALQRASVHQKLVLASVIKCSRQSGVAGNAVQQVLGEHGRLCLARTMAVPPLSQMRAVMAQLQLWKWIVVEGGRELEMQALVRLNLMEEDVVFLFKKTKDERIKDLI